MSRSTPRSRPPCQRGDACPVGGRSLAAGTVVAGRFRCTAWLGTGGVADVFEAVDLRGGATVAVKCMRLPPIKMTDAIRETLVARFRDETRIMYRLFGDVFRALDAPAAGARHAA